MGGSKQRLAAMLAYFLFGAALVAAMGVGFFWVILGGIFHG